MASVKSPESTYLPNLPKRVIEDGRLSGAQLVNVIQAGQSHGVLRRTASAAGTSLGTVPGSARARRLPASSSTTGIKAESAPSG